MYESLVDCIHATHGDHVKVISLDINYDKMILDQAGRRNLKPLKVRIKNLRKELQGKSSNTMTVAYGPVFLDSPPQLHKMLKKKVHTKSKRSSAVSYINRYIVATTCTLPAWLLTNVFICRTYTLLS
jgi:hypothetical protein